MVEARDEQEAVLRASAHFRRLGHYIHEAKVLKKKDEQLNELANSTFIDDSAAKVGLKRNPGESDADLINRINAEKGIDDNPIEPVFPELDILGGVTRAGTSILSLIRGGAVPKTVPTPRRVPQRRTPERPAPQRRRPGYTPKPAPEPAPAPKPAPAPVPAPKPEPAPAPVPAPVTVPQPITLPPVPPATTVPRPIEVPVTPKTVPETVPLPVPVPAPKPVPRTVPVPMPKPVPVPEKPPVTAKTPVGKVTPVTTPNPLTVPKTAPASAGKPIGPRPPRPFFIPSANRGEVDIGTLGQYRGMFPLYPFAEFQGGLQEGMGSSLNAIGRVLAKRKKVDKKDSESEKNKINMEPTLSGK